jgi:hypothetical protein
VPKAYEGMEGRKMMTKENCRQKKTVYKKKYIKKTFLTKFYPETTYEVGSV